MTDLFEVLMVISIAIIAVALASTARTLMSLRGSPPKQKERMSLEEPDKEEE